MNIAIVFLEYIKASFFRKITKTVISLSDISVTKRQTTLLNLNTLFI